MCVAYGLVAIVDINYAQKGVSTFIGMVKTLLPALLLVFLLLILFNLIQNIQSRLAGVTGAGSGIKGWWVAIVGGVLSHGPIYAWYPLLGELRSQGMRPALLAAFLYARSIKLPFLPVMVHYFGLAYTVVFSLYIVLFSLFNGWLTERLLYIGKTDDAKNVSKGGLTP
ncbi:MAG TPA: permease [Gammaproteobacteria bacterium]|nr:permease [Gammaproteobacteria bacterium]